METYVDATEFGGSWKEKGFLLSPGKEEGGGHVDISLHLEPTMDISDKTGAKVDPPCSCPRPSLFTGTSHRTQRGGGLFYK